MEPSSRAKRHRMTPACARCYRLKQKCDRGTPKCLRCVTAGVECAAINRQTSSEIPRSPVQYLEQRLAELQHGNAKQHLGLGSPNPKHEEMLDIVATSITNHLTTNLFYSQPVLQHRAKLFYPSERPPLKIPIQGVYYDAHPRSAGQEYATQFSHFNAKKMPLDVARRLFENYKDNILPRFPCFVEADLTDQFRQFYHGFADDQARSNTTHFVITVILAISSLSSKRHDFRKVAALTESLHADAMRHMGFLSDASITSLQCLLLLIQLALLFPHTGNLWYLSGEAMRMAVGLGLHQEPDSTIVSSSIHVELRRRIFWVTYQLDRTVAIAAGCPIALADEHITTQLPFNGGRASARLDRPIPGMSHVHKEKQFLIQTQMCLVQSQIHAVQFFDHPIPDHISDYESWIQQTEEAVLNLVQHVKADGVATTWLVSAAHQCQVLLHRPCSRNIAVSESSLTAAVSASIQLINTSLESAIAGGFVIVFELANSAFQAGMVLLYALRNHANEVQQASLASNSQNALDGLVQLFVSK
ncbi:fungal-specific transcription factor domain-containing protein [Ilyonectria destructans]|nr:fungal-specific transcription factor domain-containing protein [Ilyonectria destructans]